MPPFLAALLLAAALSPKSTAHAVHSAPRPPARARASRAHPPAPAPRLEAVTAEVLSRGSRLGHDVALTFDACSTRANELDARIVRILVATHTPATIFLGGRWTEHNQAQVRYLASLPQIELENHTWSHPHMTRLSPARVRAELLRTEDQVYAVTGKEPTFWRPPFGEYDTKVVETAAALGLMTVEYDLPSGDPDPHATAPRLVDWVLRKVRPGDIVVMHLNHLKFHTAEALPAIIRGLRQRGFKLVTVRELLADGPLLAPGAPGPKDPKR